MNTTIIKNIIIMFFIIVMNTHIIKHKCIIIIYNKLNIKLLQKKKKNQDIEIKIMVQNIVKNLR